MGFSSLGMSQLSTQYYLVPIAAAKAGASYNPTGDQVLFAFMPQATQVPTGGDWVAGSWDTNTTSLLFPYSAKCLVGPLGTTNPGIGNYYVYVKVSDNPEVPVTIVGLLEIS